MDNHSDNGITGSDRNIETQLHALLHAARTERDRNEAIAEALAQRLLHAGLPIPKCALRIGAIAYLVEQHAGVSA